jgi:hypothetical protein
MAKGKWTKGETTIYNKIKDRDSISPFLPYHLINVLSVLQITTSTYPFGIFILSLHFVFVS